MSDLLTTSALPPIVQVDQDQCVNCHMCISVCPVKFCNDGSGNYLNVNHDRCIGCGRCISACTHQARLYCDDFAAFTNDLSQGEKIVAIVAPSVASNFPDQYLQLNGWLKAMGVAAVFDVGFGAELSARSYANMLQTGHDKTIIAQPCPVIVDYIQIYAPKLLPHLAPVDSPMLHLMKMIRTFHPEFADHRIAAISPCLAKKREFCESDHGEYNVTFLSINQHLQDEGIELATFPPEPYLTPTPERAVEFPTPGGLMQTVERWVPDISRKTRKVEGEYAVYPYLSGLEETLSNHKDSMPLLVDCLNCPMGCNSGPASLTSNEPPDIVEHHVKKRSEKLQDLTAQTSSANHLDQMIEKYWKPELYQREYRNLSHLNNIQIPTHSERTEILHRMHKHSDADQYNCSSCGYSSCEAMCTAIHNNLNRVENCHHYLIAERTIAQDIITQKEQRLSSILNTSLEGFIQLDKDGHIQDVNKSMCSMVKRPKSNLLGSKFKDLLPPEHQELLQKQLHLRKAKRNSRYEISITQPDGTLRHLMCHGSPLLNPEGKHIGSFAMVTDITAIKHTQAELAQHQNHLEELVKKRTLSLKNEIEFRKTAERDLRAYDQQLKTLFNHTPLGIIVIDCETRLITEANPVAAEMIGLPTSNLVGRSCSLFCPAENNACPVLDCGMNVENVERTLRCQTGAMLPILKTVVPLRLGGRDCLLESFVDISDQKNIRDTLEKAKEAAEINNRTKSEFIANMSHEIRTPMNAITGLSYLALNTELTSKQRNYLTKIQSASTNLLDIINDILDFSKIEEGKIEIESIPFDLENVIIQLLDIFGQEVQNKELTLHFNISPDVPAMLTGDPLRLRQVLTNLIGNALKFTEQGEITLHIKSVNRTAQKVLLEFAVQDTGIGIAPDHLDKIFESFSQADTSTTREYGGTGLGLSISQHLVSLMGGKIHIESETGQGSSFIFAIELGLPDASPQPQVNLNGLHVLLIDHPNSIKKTTHQLESLSCRVQTAKSGEHALQLIIHAATNDPVQLILLNWDTAQNHPQLYAHLNTLQTQTAGRPKLILTSSYWNRELSDAVHRENVDAFLQKPFSHVSLQNTLAPLFKQHTPDFLPNNKVSPPDLRAKRILLAEDNEINQEIVKELLDYTGCSLTITNNGKEALNTYLDSKFDLILMDVQMPILDGIASTQHIRKQEKENNLPRIPIIALSANAMNRDKDASRAAGMDAHLSKPVDPAELFSIINEWVTPKKPSLTGRILLAEPAEINQMITSEILHSFGVETTIANSSEEAIELARSSSFDLILMSLEMPCMSGHKATQILRNAEHLADLPILAFTTTKAEEETQNLSNNGLNGYIRKPFEPDALFQAIQPWLS